MTTGESTTDIAKAAANVVTDASDAAQAAVSGDGTVKSQAESNLLSDLETLGSEAVVDLFKRLLALEAKSGFGIETLITSLLTRVGGIL